MKKTWAVVLSAIGLSSCAPKTEVPSKAEVEQGVAQLNAQQPAGACAQYKAATLPNGETKGYLDQSKCPKTDWVKKGSNALLRQPTARVPAPKHTPAKNPKMIAWGRDSR